MRAPVGGVPSGRRHRQPGHCPVTRFQERRAGHIGSVGTFQRGIEPGDIAALALRAGLVPVTDAPVLPLPGVCHAVLAKTRT
ncbi:hypothetical protein [Streptomyces sp. NPDC059631]|uniref:hypothetical protein n=1 Tax=unclassified Streptomyces TaxID=2593676 RepID=UPI0036828D4C